MGTTCIKDTCLQILLLLLEVLKVDVLEVLRRLALYSKIRKPETSNTTRINKTEHQTEDYKQYDAMA
jgi:hypothetical protein